MRVVFLLLLYHISHIQGWKERGELDNWDDEYHNQISGREDSAIKMENRQIQSRSGFTAATFIENLDAAYGILTADRVILGFYLTIVVQYVSTVVGWLALGRIWNAARGIEVDEENMLDLPALFDFATNPTGTSLNILISAGAFVSGVAMLLFFGNIGAFFGPKNSDTKRSESPAPDGPQGPQEDSVIKQTLDLFLQVADQRFSPQGIAEITWISTRGSVGFLLFWLVVSMLPKQEATSRRGKRELHHREEEFIERSHHREKESIERSLVLLDRATLFIEGL